MSATQALTDERRRELLEEVQRIGSDADAHEDLLRVFLPLPMHTQALQRRTIVIRGERGAGKTALFHFLQRLREAEIPVHDVFPGVDADDVLWVEGYSEHGTKHPSDLVLSPFAAGATDEALRTFWLGHLIGRLVDEIPEVARLPEPFGAAWRAGRTTPDRWMGAAQGQIGELVQWLDTFDASGRSTYVTYDYLDRIAITMPAVQRRLTTSLLNLWLSLSNRYQRVRAKIFLRDDLFDRSLVGFADASKLESRSVPLHWNTETLYRLLVRHLAAADGVREWMGKSHRRVELTRNPLLGWMPPAAFPEDAQRAFTERLAGTYMGRGEKKGYVYRWIPNHLQDAHGAIVPRSMLNLVAYAADWALKHGPKATYGCLLHHEELQPALEKTSLRRVAELGEEHPVVQRLEQMRGLVLLATRDEVVQRLSQPVPQVADGFGNDGDAVFDELLRLGVVKVRDDGRIDVPDLYRYGYGIKRKGGVSRPR